jgi:hypothetical protein
VLVSAQLGELLLLLRFLVPRGRRPGHDEFVDVVIVNLREIVDSGVGDVAKDVFDDACHNLPILLGRGGLGLLFHLLVGGPGLFGIGLMFWLVVFVCHWLRAWPAFIGLLSLSLLGWRREDYLADIL